MRPPSAPSLRLLITALLLAALGLLLSSFGGGPAGAGSAEGVVPTYPKVHPGHRHLRLVLDNAFEYLNPAHGLVDPASGYPVEGWNQQPQKGLFLRSLTQLTAIGAWIELLANIAAGGADNRYVSREAALDGLDLAVSTLLADQRDPALAAKGLLVNFMSIEGGKRMGPLLETIERRRFLETFGDPKGQAVWRALVEKGWLLEEDNGRKGRIRRVPGVRE
jgi:hypothetical protein